MLTSPADQVLRADGVDTLVLGLANPAGVARVQVYARTGDTAPWTALTAAVATTALRRGAAGIEVPLAWPADWRAKGIIADRLRIALTSATADAHVRVQRIALYPRATAAGERSAGAPQSLANGARRHEHFAGQRLGLR